MSLKSSIMEEIKKALKAGDRARTSTLRLVLSAIKNREIELRRELRDEEAIEVLAALAKQRRDSIDHFKKASRDDLVLKEEEELRIITSFMPPPLSEKEIEDMVQDAITRLGAKGKGDIGRVMKELMSRIKGRAEGRRVKVIVERLLTS